MNFLHSILDYKHNKTHYIQRTLNMDPAQEIERNILALQNPMNAVIDKGDSPVQKFYNGTTVFVTGGSGFIGKQLIEKLFRACAIKKMYVLLRLRKGRTMQERLQHMLKDPVFDAVRNKQPKFADKIVPIEGDVADIKLGLNEKDFDVLIKEVNIIFHVAATVSFEEPLTKATFINLRGTREVVTLARECPKLKKLIHVSTAFSHATKDRINTDVLEDFYPCPLPPETMIEMAETLERTRLDDITKTLITGWPNTYTFTKALAENLIKNMAGDLPVCIVRPPIVSPAYCEPSPGWLDFRTLIGPSGIVLGSGMGVLQVYYANQNARFAISPVDYVTNAIISAGWDSYMKHNNGEHIPIYLIKKYTRYGSIRDTIIKHKKRLATPMAVYRGNLILTNLKILYFLLSWFYHFIPAYTLDFVCKIMGQMPKEIKSFVEIYKLTDKLGVMYEYFTHNHWNFKDDNLRAMITRMDDVDRDIFNCDVSRIDLEEYVLAWVIGLRKFIIKDGLTGTPEGYRKQIIFTFVHYFIVLPLYIYALWWTFSTMFVLLSSFICFFL